MDVDFRRREQNSNLYIQETIIDLITLFGNLWYNEILDFFPAYDEKEIRNSINELQSIKYILPKKSIVDNRTYFTTPFLNRNSSGFKTRQTYLASCKFVRYLLNVKDEHGYLVNTIDEISTYKYPFDIYIVCNDSVYDIVHCTKNDIVLYEKVLGRKDEVFDKEQQSLQLRQASKVPYTIIEEKDRIVLVDSEEDMDLIHFRKVKYIACPHNKRYIFKEGA